MSGSGQGRKPPPRGKRTLVADRRTRLRGGNPPGHVRARRQPATRRKRTAARKTAPWPARLDRGGDFRTSSCVLLWGLAWRGGVAVAVILAMATGYYYVQLPDVSDAVDTRSRGSVTMLDRDGNVFAWRGDQFGGVIDPDTASPHLVHAVVATEDRRFYRHLGVSPRGIAGAIRINLREGRGPLEGHGGSTITQQVAKLMCLGVPYDPELWETEVAYEQDCRRTTIWRKLQEVPFAFAMELRYSKDEILSIYLNRAYLGAGARGFEGAAQRYFGVSAAELDAGAGRDAGRSSGGAVLLRAHAQPRTRAAAGGDGPEPHGAGGLPDRGRGGGRDEQPRDPVGGGRAEYRRLLRRLDHGRGSGLPDQRHDRGCADPHHLRPRHAGRRRGRAGRGLRQPGARRVRGAGRHRGDERRRRCPCHGRRARHPGRGPVQPRDPGDAADRFRLQALRLCHRAGPGLALRRHDPRRAADDRRAGVGALFARRTTPTSSMAT
jgi:hypothetical protein